MCQQLYIAIKNAANRSKVSNVTALFDLYLYLSFKFMEISPVVSKLSAIARNLGVGCVFSIRGLSGVVFRGYHPLKFV